MEGEGTRGQRGDEGVRPEQGSRRMAMNELHDACDLSCIHIRTSLVTFSLHSGGWSAAAKRVVVEAGQRP